MSSYEEIMGREASDDELENFFSSTKNMFDE
jgi:hypothetical protein